MFDFLKKYDKNIQYLKRKFPEIYKIKKVDDEYIVFIRKEKLVYIDVLGKENCRNHKIIKDLVLLRGGEIGYQRRDETNLYYRIRLSRFDIEKLKQLWD